MDLLNAGSLQAGMPLFPRQRKYAGRVATLLPNGHLEVDDASFPTPSDAATMIRGKKTSGWWFFLVDRASKRSLRDVWRDYDDAPDMDAEEEDADDEGNEDDR